MREMKDSGVEWIGKIPKDWEIVPLTKQLDSIVDYRGKTPEKTEEGTFLVTAKNIKDGKICYELSKEYVREADYEEIMHRGIPQIGDILFTTEAPLGQVANVDRTDIALAQRIIKFRAFDVINLLSEQGAVDELGIGVIRDAFANYFFPGTSTIQTRAKYFLIVPYMLREAVDGRYGKDANRVLRAIDSAEKDCGIRLLEADPKAEGVIGSRVLPKGWVARKPSDIYWNGIRTFGIFCDYGLSIPEYVSLAVKLKEQKSVSRLGNRNDDAEENDKDDSDAGDIGNIRFWNLPIYHDDWRDNLTIELTQEEAFYLDKQIQKSTKGSLLEYVLKNRIDLNEYDDFASLTAELSEKVGEKLAYMMKLACDFNNLVYMARVRYNVMLSEDENTYANDEWSRLLPDIRHNATVDLDAVFGEFQLINPRAKSFLCGIQAAFITLDIDMADELIRKRERSLKGAARAKLSRTKEFDHSKWVGGGMLDYRFSNARRIVNDIYAGEVSADV